MTQPYPSLPRFTSAGARVAVVAVAALLQLAFLLWVARSAVTQGLHCEVCDTSYYFRAATDIARSGLLFANPFDGYRSYFVPFFIAAVQQLTAWAGFDGNPVERYAYGVSVLFWLASTGLMAWLLSRTRTLGVLLTVAATVLNPFLVAYVPFALQEGVLMACCLPLLLVWAGAKDLRAPARAALVLTMAFVAYVVRASLVWWLLPAAAYAVALIWPHLRHPRRWLPSMATVGIVACILIAPQVYISKSKADTLNPYFTTGLLARQIAWGISLLKFATVEDEGHWRGLTYVSPFVAEPEEEKTLGFYVRHPSRGAFLIAGHAYAGFHYDQILPYWPLARARPLTIWLVLSSAIVFLGVVSFAGKVLAKSLDADDAVALATVALCVASLLFVAPEARFGAIGFAMLSLQVARWLGTRPSSSAWTLLGPALLMYLALSISYNTLLLQSADVGL